MKMNDRLNGFVWGICIGAIVAVITGLTMGWIVTGTKSEAMAKKGAEVALVTAMTPICVDRFQRTEGSVDRLATLKKIDASWERRNFIQKGDWAKIGQTSSFELADACADALNKL
jgi:hypothetical protein